MNNIQNLKSLLCILYNDIKCILFNYFFFLQKETSTKSALPAQPVDAASASAYQESPDSITLSLVGPVEIIQDVNDDKTILRRRPKKKCPECGNLRKDLPAHMSKIHNWDTKKASKVNLLTNQRKRHATTKRWMRKERVACQEPGCFSFVFNMSAHMKLKHKNKNIIIEKSKFYNFSEINNEIPECPDKDSDSSDLNIVDNEINTLISDFIETCTVEPFNEDINSGKDYILPTSLEEMLKDFDEWLRGPQGGGNKPVTAEQNGNMIGRIMKDLRCQSLDDILDDTSLWRMFLAKKESGSWRGQTARSYMVAIKKFMGFIIKDARHKKYSTAEQRELASTNFADLPNWSKSYKNQIGVESATKKLEQLDVLLTPDKINMYKASEEHRNAIKLLGQCQETTFEVTPCIFTITRNFLMFQLNVRNANRAGVLAELTLDNFEARRKYHNRVSGRTECIITIRDHKTLASAGPAKLAMSLQLENQMQLFKSYIR